MSEVVLTTLNARYIHASLGLRYLAANMGALEAATEIVEFVINQRPIEIVEAILARGPRLVGFGVYIWNVEETAKAIAMLKAVRPDIVVVIGGPEVSYEVDAQRITALADYVVTGPGDTSFAKLAAQVLGGAAPAGRVITGEQPALDALTLPYALYTDRDLRERLVYVEASRGCPFKCEFCLSSLGKTAWPFPLEAFLAALAALHARGARHFKFVDRTFNLNVKTSAAILEFFLARIADDLFVHFELIPDHLPEKLKTLVRRFPPGALQFEIGIQTFNPEVQTRISRKQDDDEAAANLRWLRRETHAHIHADLIAGLPGEDLVSFGRGFDRLVALGPHEVQLGILKRLRGTPIIRHTEAFGMRYNPDPPYNVLATDCIDFATMQRIVRFARYWDLVANSGRFMRGLPLVLADQPFVRFMRFADWLYATTGKTHEIALDRLYDLVYRGLTEALAIDPPSALEALAADYTASGARGAPAFMETLPKSRRPRGRAPDAGVPARQARHLTS